MTLTLESPLSHFTPERLREINAALGWVPEWHQMAPKGDWTYWLFVAGRGAGKTDAGSHYVDQHANGPACLTGNVPHRIAIAAPTLGDARLTCVKGESGILAHNPDVRFTFTDGELFWPNGSHGRIFGAYTPEDVERWRGPQHCLVWADELAAWRQLVACWENMRLGLRLGDHPKVVGTTTPKPRKLLKDLMARKDTAITRASTNDNPHLTQLVRAELYDLFKGTRLERQELGGELVEDVDGALWTRQILDDLRQPAPEQMRRIVVAVDPAVTSNPESDETGIMVTAVDTQGMGWVLDDWTVRASPAGWASRAVAAYHTYKADRIVAEANNGGEMVEYTIHTIDPTVPVKIVHASQGKRTRAEPISAKYEQGKIRHNSKADLALVEDQLCGWDPGSDESPDRLDALVWGLTELMLVKGGWAGVQGPAGGWT